jgi:hypothetical protein
MTLLPPKLLVIPKYFFLQFFDIDETLARAQKCPSLPLIFRWGIRSGCDKRRLGRRESVCGSPTHGHAELFDLSKIGGAATADRRKAAAQRQPSVIGIRFALYAQGSLAGLKEPP